MTCEECHGNGTVATLEQRFILGQWVAFRRLVPCECQRRDHDTEWKERRERQREQRAEEVDDG